MTYDIIVYGPVFCDLIFTGLPAMPALGTETFADGLTVSVGGAAIVAAGLQRLGLRTGLIAELGSDPMSGLMRNLLNDLGIDCTLIREHPYPLPQVTVGLSFPADRAFVTRFEHPRTVPDLAAILRDHPARHLHICSFLAALETPDAAAIAHAAGMTVSMDPGWDDLALRDPRLAAMIADLDIFLPNLAEICHITACSNKHEAVTATCDAMRLGTLVLKEGADGATAYTHGGAAKVHAAALPIVPVDTTGAGDAFDAGFLYGFLAGEPVDTCMRYGTVCGGLSTTQPGGIDALPTLAEMTLWLSRLPS